MLLFAHRLALAMGEVDVEGMLQRIDSRQLSQWMAYDQIQPFGQGHTDYLTAQLTAVISNRWRGKSEPPTKVEEWLPRHKEPPQSPEQMFSAIRQAKGLLNGRSSKP